MSEKDLWIDKPINKSFVTDGNVDKQGTKWFKRLKGIFYSSFIKIRHTSRNIQTELSTLMEARRIELAKLKNTTEEQKDEVKSRILKLEDEICDMLLSQIEIKWWIILKNLQILREFFKQIKCGVSRGRCSQRTMSPYHLQRRIVMEGSSQHSLS